MYKDLSLVFFIIIGLLTVVNYKNIKHKGITFHKLSILLYMLCFSIVPLFIIISGDILQYVEYKVPLYYSVDMESSNFLYASILALLGYLSYIAGYKFKAIRHGKNNTGYKCIDNNTKIKIAGHILFFISSISIVAYLGALGIETILLNIQKFRLESPGQIGILRRFMPLTSVSFICYYYLSKMKFRGYKVLAIINFIIALFYYIFINAGRLPLMSFLMIVPIYKITKKKLKIKKTHLVPIIIFGSMIILYADPIFDYIAYGKPIEIGINSVKNIIAKTLLSFSFPIINLLNIREFTYSVGEFRYFIDFFTWIINIFPSAITEALGFGKILSSWEINTMNYGSLNWGGIPTDIITFGYYQFSYPGVLLVSFLYGHIVCAFDRLITTNQIFYNLLKIKLFFFIPFIIMYADFEQIMISRIDYIIPIMIFIIFNKKERVRREDEYVN